MSRENFRYVKFFTITAILLSFLSKPSTFKVLDLLYLEVCPNACPLVRVGNFESVPPSLIGRLSSRVCPLVLALIHVWSVGLLRVCPSIRRSTFRLKVCPLVRSTFEHWVFLNLEL